MPLPQMFTNIEVLNQARKNFNRKVACAMQGADKVKKPQAKDENGKVVRLPFDVRYPTDIACLIIDTNGIPDEELDAYVIEETRKIAEAFYTVDEKTYLPDPAAIKPYIEMLFNKMLCDPNIDWNDANQVERFLATQQVSQGFATLPAEFPSLFSELYPSFDRINWFDSYTAKATLVFNRSEVLLACIPNPEDPPNKQEKASRRYETVEDRLLYEVATPIFDARLQGSNEIYLDAVASDFTKKYFLKQEFEEYYREDLYTSDMYASRYFEYFATAYKNAGIEQMIDLAISNTFKDEPFQYGRLFINGKSIKDSIEEMEAREGPNFNAEVAASKMFRDALTDGKSIVTLMHALTGPGGETKFSHQEIKVDLDRLNKVDKEETNYSLFRRVLDWAHIWKIQKYNTNDERDAAQNQKRNEPAFQDALRKAEDKFIDLYNSAPVQERIAQYRPAMAAAFPKLVRAEDVEKEKTVTDDLNRTKLTDVAKDLEIPVPVEPKHDDVEKTISNDTKQLN